MVDIKMIVAVDEEWGIGKDGGMLVHLPSDLRYFREKTLGGVCLMGRRTLESLSHGKGLAGRVNIVISKTMSAADAEKKDCYLAESVEKALSLLDSNDVMVNDKSKIFVIGGGQLYAGMLPYASAVLVTKISGVHEADTFFPNLDEDENFYEADSGEPLEENGISFSFCEYKRK
ncbi:MAG: dihydrofolate reductase [Clostridiales Family XIII bacterium]|jgi:dihydrofolate reductase|nr:dihydrofolate reductase [Clostridiales Family XIII bacterium]